MAKVTFDMEINDITKKDHIEFTRRKSDKANEQFNTQLKSGAKKALERGILFLVLGVLLTLAGIGPTEATHGGLVFYGLVLSGIAALVFGGLELSLYRELKK